jgi:drug/metabolite transporter (DMT)-like permease
MNEVGMRRMTRRNWLLFAAMCVIWGVPYLLIRVAVRDMSPACLVFARTGIAALLLLPLALRRRELGPAIRRWRPLVAYTVVELTIPWLLLSDAETKLSSSLSGLLVAAVPLAGVGALALLRAGDPVGRTGMAGLLLGLVGVAALVGLDFGHINAFALAEVAVVVVGYAVGPIILSRSLSDLPAIGVVTASLLLTALVYLPAAIIAPPRRYTAAGISSVLGLAVVCTALAFVVFFALIAGIGPSRAVVITYVNPAVALSLGVVVLGEPFTAGMAVGFPLILAGSVLAARRRGDARSRPVEGGAASGGSASDEPVSSGNAAAAAPGAPRR